MQTSKTTRITLTVTAVVRGLFLASALLVLASLAVLLFCHLVHGASPHDVRWAQFFYLDGERNIPTAFSVFLLVSAATLLVFIASLERHRRGFALYWMVLAAGFACMATDEAWSFHEKMTAAVRPLLGQGGLGVWYHAWVVPALLVVGAAGLFFLRFLLRLPRSTRIAFLVAGAVYVAGAVGIELVEGLFDEVYGDRTLLAGLIATVQESMEMGGVILFVRALLRYLAQTYPVFQVSLEAAPAAAAHPHPPPDLSRLSCSTMRGSNASFS